MKVKIILFILVITMPIIIFLTNKTEIIELTVKTNNTDNIIIKNNKFETKIEYPITEYSILNKEIHQTIDYYQKEFYNDLKDITNKNQYNLNISYKEYSYNNYLSYIFYIETDLGGAHPNHQISTISYDIKNNKLITINTLIEYNNNILNILSNLSRKQLQKIEIFKNADIIDMMLDGTTPIKNNFKNFVFTSNGLMLIFERYQIAPYYFGEYNITIPYQQIA